MIILCIKNWRTDTVDGFLFRNKTVAKRWLDNKIENGRLPLWRIHDGDAWIEASSPRAVSYISMVPNQVYTGYMQVR